MERVLSVGHRPVRCPARHLQSSTEANKHKGIRWGRSVGDRAPIHLLVLCWRHVVFGVIYFCTDLYLRADIPVCWRPHRVAYCLVLTHALLQNAMTPNSAAHPEPRKRRTVSFLLSRRPGGRER